MNYEPVESMQSKLQASKKQTSRLGIVLSITLILLACIAMGSVAGQDSNEYNIDVDSSVTVVPQEITVDRPGFGTYQIDLVGLYDSGDSMTASVTTPGDTDPSSVEFQLYDPSGQLIAEKVPDDGGQATFSGNTTELSPGTYQLVALSSSQQAEALTPIVISGYDISVTHTSTVEQSGELRIDGTTEETEATEPPASLNVILRNEDYNERVSVDTNGDSYSTNISMAGFPSGEYNLYVTANGDEQYQGENEIKAIAEGDTVTVTQADTGDGDGSDDDNDNGDDSGDGDNDDTDSNNGDNSDSDDNDGESNDNDGGDSDSDGSDNSNNTGGDGDSGDSDTGDDVIEPDSSSNESTTTNPTSTDDQTSLNISLVIVAILISTAYVSHKTD